ncbi:MAG: glutathione S-transferase family protein [Alphaproteobacteria bacterium]|nr:glutathione S-transferase family protein [Alphaproteobacteria bacterium]
MAELVLAIANKAYSSWSLRGWLGLKLTGAPFREVVIPLRQAETRAEILKYSPSAKLPALIDGELAVWESLAIIEYLAEKFPEAGLWPADRAARAQARAAANEMHGGFLALRRAMPMNMRHSFPDASFDDDIQAEVNRIQAIWRDAGRRFADACGEGPFLMGGFSAIDAMFAPVASRFDTYGIDLESHARDYVDAVLAHPFMAEWRDAAMTEPWIIPEFEFDGAAD